MKHFYILFEFSQSGYLITKAKSNLYLKEMEKHYQKIRDFLGEQMYLDKSNLEIVKALKLILSYSIETYKADIILKENSKSIINIITGAGEKNSLYLIVSNDEITDFTNLPRTEPSLDCFFSSVIKDEDGEDTVQELYLN